MRSSAAPLETERHPLRASFMTLLCLACVLGWPGVARSEPLQAELKLGVEVDSNASREEGQVVQSDALTRYFLKLVSRQSAGSGQSLSLKFRSGGKLYQEIDTEDAWLNQGDVRYMIQPLSTWDQRWLFLYANGSLKDRTERGRRRDYLLTSGSGGVGLSLGPVSLTLGSGASLFVFKPNRELSNRGPLTEASAQWRLSDAWLLRAGLGLRRRDYDTARFIGREPGQVARDLETARSDQTRSLVAGVSYRGPVIVSLDLTWLDVASNSFGQSLARVGGVVSLTTPLPWSFFFHGRFSLQRTLYDDEVLIQDASLLVDEDNRNALSLELERSLYGALGVSARYALYTQEFGAREADYSRRLLFVGLDVEY